MRDGLVWKIMVESAVLTIKVYSYFIDDGDENKNTKGTKKCVIKQNLKFNDYKNCHRIHKKQKNSIKITAKIHKVET